MLNHHDPIEMNGKLGLGRDIHSTDIYFVIEFIFPNLWVFCPQFSVMNM